MQRNDALSLVVKDDDRDTPAEVLKVLANPEEVGRQRVVEQEVLYFLADFRGAGGRVIHKS